MVNKQSINRDLLRLEDLAKGSLEANVESYWNALEDYFRPDVDRVPEPDPADYVPAADTEHEAESALGRGSWWAFGAKYIAYREDYSASSQAGSGSTTEGQDAR